MVFCKMTKEELEQEISNMLDWFHESSKNEVLNAVQPLMFINIPPQLIWTVVQKIVSAIKNEYGE